MSNDYSLCDQYLNSICPKPSATSLSFSRCNDNKNTLDIIIPCFNAEKYIEECLNHLLPGIPKDVRIILVNDGSSDSTSKIIHSFNDYDNVLILDQENGGAASARNAALRHLNAQYVTFIDADDYMDMNALIFMLNILQESNADVIECDLTNNCSAFLSDSLNINFKSDTRSTFDNTVFSGICNPDCSSISVRCFTSGYICGKIYRSDIFQNIIFPEGCWFEDTILKFIIAPRCNKIIHVSKAFYYYRPNESGCTSQVSGNLKSIETYWVTELLISDLMNSQAPITRDMYDEFLYQLVLNFVRTHTLDETVHTAIFFKSCKLLENIRKYLGFENGTIAQHTDSAHTHNKFLRPLETALLFQNYNLYRNVCPVIWEHRLTGNDIEPMNVAIAINRSFLKYAIVFSTSLFENHPLRKINLYILYSDIPEHELLEFQVLEAKYNQQIFCQEISEADLPESLPHSDYWPIEIYFRLFLPLIIPECEKRILYLDTDIIVNKNIEEFYDEDFSGFSLIACRDTSVESGGLTELQTQYLSSVSDTPAKDYFNSGVLLMNLEKIRQQGGSSMLVQKLSEDKEKVFAPDQDLLNFIFHGDVKFEDPHKYNCFARETHNRGISCDELRELASIIHYTGRKPWTGEAIRYNSELIWWEYAQKTEIYTELLEEVLLNEIKSDFADNQFKALAAERDDLYQLVLKFKVFMENHQD